MQDPQAIIQAIRNGNAPAAWKVLRPTRSNVPLSVFYGAFFGCFGLIVLTVCSTFAVIVLGALGAAKALQQIQLTPSGANPDPSVIFNRILQYGPIAVISLVAIPIVVIALGAIIGGVRATSTANDSYLVITPDGVVEALSKTRISAIDFSALADVTTLMVVQNNQTSAMLELHYSNGTKRTWHPSFRFGSDQSVIQRIVKAFQDYAATADARSRGIR